MILLEVFFMKLWSKLITIWPTLFPRHGSNHPFILSFFRQQTLSIAKAGIICQLNARTSLLAAANPVESQWNKYKTIVENVNLPHTLLSRYISQDFHTNLNLSISFIRNILILIISFVLLDLI